MLFLSRENCCAVSGNYALQTLIGLLYVLVTPVVKFRFGLEAAGSATCKKKLFCIFKAEEISTTALGAC